MKQTGIVAALVALVVFATWRKLALHSVSEWPLGVDGFYYAIQMRSLLEDATLWRSTQPLAFLVMAPFAMAFGAIAGVKVAASLLMALIAVPMFFIGRRIGGSWGAGLLAAAIASLSAGSTMLSVEFVKNGVGMTLAATFIALALQRRAYALLALLALIAAAFTHPLALAVALFFALALTLTHARRLVVLVVAASIAAAVFFSNHPVWSSPIFGDAEWTLPALAHRVSAGYEPLIAVVVSVIAVALMIRRRAPHAIVIGAVVLALVIAFPWLDVRDEHSVGYRLRLIAFFPLAIIAAYGIGALDKIAAALTLAWVLVHAPLDREGVVVANPAHVPALQELERVIPKDAVVICPVRQVMFMAVWFARVDARLTPSANATHRLIPRSYLRSFGPEIESALAQAMSAQPVTNLHARDPHGLVLMSEETWRVVVEQLEPTQRARVAAWPTR